MPLGDGLILENGLDLGAKCYIINWSASAGKGGRGKSGRHFISCLDNAVFGVMVGPFRRLPPADSIFQDKAHS